MEDVEDCQKAIPYLRSCKQECSQPISGESTGTIPPWLNGHLIRIGGGLLEIGPDKLNHIFDSMALMHKFSITDGNVTYSNRFLRSDSYKLNTEANRLCVSEFGTRASPDPCKTIFQRFFSTFSAAERTDNDLVNIIKFTDEYYACTESTLIWKIDPSTLESIEKVDLSKIVATKSATAHAHEDVDGTVYNMGNSFSPSPYYNILKFPPKGDKTSPPFAGASIVCKIPARNRTAFSYYHSFGMSENYFVFVEYPLEISVPSLVLFNFMTSTYSQKMKWNPQQKAAFHVVRRDTGELLKTKYLSNPFMFFHHINAYEEDDHLIVDICSYKDDIAVTSLYVESLKKRFQQDGSMFTVLMDSRGVRFVLPLNDVNIAQKEIGENLVTVANTSSTAVRQKDGSVLCVPESLIPDDLWQPELPRINYEKYNGRKYKYFYAIARNRESNETSLIKVDVVSKDVLVWNEDGTWPSEPVFVSSPGSSDEDDGVILVSLLSKSDPRKVSFVVLNAKTMTELGRSVFQTESSVPADFHGIYISKDQNQ